MLTAGLVLAVMILPIISAVSREVFSQTPRRLEEGALALGATRWEMIRMVVLPFGKSAVISGSMLGLGRALGETMAVTIILSVSGIVTFDLVSQENPTPIAANIALKFPESSGHRRQRPDRLRPRPLRDHAGREHDRPPGHLPLERPIEPMADDTEREPGGGLRPGGDGLAARRPDARRAARCRPGSCGRWSAARALISLAVLLATGGFTIVLLFVLTVRPRPADRPTSGRGSTEGRRRGQGPPGDARDRRPASASRSPR